jgi:PAS domain S-box-containing protein
MLILSLVILSILFQLGAAYMAVRLIKTTGQRLSWALIATAMLLQVARRAISLSGYLSKTDFTTLDITSEIVGLALSVLMFLGVMYIGPFFEAIQKSIKERIAAENSLRASNRELKTISGCNQAVVHAHDEQWLMDEICRIVGERAGYDAIWAGLITDDRKNITIAALTGLDRSHFAASNVCMAGLDVSDPLLTAVTQNKYSMLSGDADKPAGFSSEMTAKLNCKSAVVLPLKDNGSVFGILNAYSRNENPFTAAEIRMLEEVSGDLAFGICDIRRRAAQQRTEQALVKTEENYRNSIQDSPLGISIVSPDGELRYANRSLLNIFGFSDSQEFSNMSRSKIYTPKSFSEHRERIKKRKNGEPVADTYEISIIRPSGEIRFLQVSRKEVLWDRQKQFETIYMDISDRKKMESDMQDSLGRLNKTLDGVVRTVAMTVEARDPYTAGHQRRVANLSIAIAKEMGLDEDTTYGVYIAGLMHDIGKIGIPAEILSKPSKLSQTEFSLIKTHPETGYDILKNIEFPYPIARCTLEHHERLDGSGYPSGLTGDQIGREARILAVADVVEAMASHRPYRAALGMAKAIEEISQNSGKRYDPDVVTACIRLLDNQSFNFESSEFVREKLA